jgi:mitochondrial import inner membrane translocase subunit TIM16
LDEHSQKHTSRRPHRKYALASSVQHPWTPLTVDQKYAAANSATGANTLSSAGLTLDEACRILNVSPPKGGQQNLERVHEQFKRLFDMNDPKKGGSFYLQSKVLRARERIELEVREAAEAAEREEEIRQGWKPKLYRD